MTELTLDDLEVGIQRFFKHWMTESSSIRDVAHKQFDHDEKFMHGLVKPRCRFGGRRPSDGLLKVGVCGGIIELYGFDAAEVVMVSSKLRVAS